jgi:hypothetical protein
MHQPWKVISNSNQPNILVINHEQARDQTHDLHPDPCRERQVNSDSLTSKANTDSEIYQEMTLKNHSATTSDSPIHSSPHASKSHTLSPEWKYESQASLSRGRSMAEGSKMIYNKWLNKEVLYTPHNNRPTMISHTINSNSQENMITANLNRSWDMDTTNSSSSHTINNLNQPSIVTTNQTHENSHPRAHSSKCKATQTHKDSRPSKILDPLPLPRARSHERRSIKSYSSDSNLAISSTTSNSPRKLSRQNSNLETTYQSRKSSPQARPQVKMETKARHRHHQSELVQQPQETQKAELNKKRAEELWGRQLALDENQTFCKNSLPRSLIFEARNKLFGSTTITSPSDALDIEIQDVLAKPLVAEVVISSPSLFNESSNNSLTSHSSSPQITTVQNLF